MSETVGFRPTEEEMLLLEGLAKSQRTSVHRVAHDMVTKALRGVKAALPSVEKLIQQARLEERARCASQIREEIEERHHAELEQATAETEERCRRQALRAVPVPCIMCHQPVSVDLTEGSQVRREIDSALGPLACHPGGCSDALSSIAGRDGVTASEMGRRIFEEGKNPFRRARTPPVGRA